MIFIRNTVRVLNKYIFSAKTEIFIRTLEFLSGLERHFTKKIKNLFF